MGLSDLIYRVYERQLATQIPPDRRPRHVGIILDGNRRWAEAQGSSSSAGHRAGAAIDADAEITRRVADRTACRDLDQTAVGDTRAPRIGVRAGDDEVAGQFVEREKMILVKK